MLAIVDAIGSVRVSFAFRARGAAATPGKYESSSKLVTGIRIPGSGSVPGLAARGAVCGGVTARGRATVAYAYESTAAGHGGYGLRYRGR